MRTPLLETQIDSKAASDNVTKEVAAERLLQTKQPSGSFIEPSDIGSMVRFLCSDACAQVTGSTFTIDGAWTAQ